MSVFQNVSGVDRELVVDGRRTEVAADGLVTVADEFDDQLIGQPDNWKFSKKKSASAETTTGPVAAIEGDV